MGRKERIEWLARPEAHDYPAAKSYLSQGDVAGTEVAYLLGFAEQSSLNRAFKRWSGQTPMEYRTLARSAKALAP